MTVRLRRVPRAVWTALALVIVAAVGATTALLREAASNVSLASDSARPAGARGLHDALARLGWRATRRTLPAARFDSTVTYVALRSRLTDAEAARLLAAVRAGAGLVLHARSGDPISDSLRLLAPRVGYFALNNQAAARDAGVRAAVDGPGCRRGPIDQQHGTQYVNLVLRDSGIVRAAGRRVFVAARRDSGTSPVIVGVPYGRGRIVAAADGAMFRNDAVRLCWSAAGPVAVAAVAWAAPGTERAGPAGAPRGEVVFLEGRDPRAGDQFVSPSTVRSVRRALTEVPAGRALATALGASLVLLAAAAPRAVAPVPAARAERRSSLEHVGALARAYREAGATRLAARRLARGLRRRHGARGAAGRGPNAPNAPNAPNRPGAPNAPNAAAADEDARFLAAVAARHAGRAEDARRVADALATPLAPAALVAVGGAAARLDRALDAARRGLDPSAE